MSDLHDLYLVHAVNPRQSSDLTQKENLLLLREREKEKSLLNSTLMLTFAGASELSNLADKYTKQAINQAIQNRITAKKEIEKFRANKLAKQEAIQQIKDLESIRREDENEKKIIRVDTGRAVNPIKPFSFHASDSEEKPELSDIRKLYYRAATRED